PDGGTRLLWAESLWRDEQHELALAQVQHVVLAEPGHDRAWDCLRAWSDELKCPERALEASRELARTRGGEARSWFVLARLLDGPDQIDERLAALEKAAELSPRWAEVHDERALT